MKIKNQFREKLKKQSQKGFRGYPVATIAFYGPDNIRATKVAVGILTSQDADPVMRKWYSETDDVRFDLKIQKEILEYIKSNPVKVKSIIMPDRIIGCPHEEGVDYPEEETCPECPYWATHDRWTGLSLN
jgi:hypothetical protein